MFRANFGRTGVYRTKGIRQLQGVKWKFRQSPEISGWFPGWKWSIAVKSNRVCVNNPGGNLYGLDSQTGQQVWIYQLGKGKKLFPFGSANGTIYFGYRLLEKITDEYLVALDSQSGQQKWQYKVPAQSLTLSFNSVMSFSAPAVADGVVYVGSNDGNLYAIDGTSGEGLWHFKTTKNMTLTSPTIEGEMLCICSSDGYLYAIDLATQQQQWKFEIGAFSFSFSTIPVIANSKVFVVTTDNILYALDLQSGETLWTFCASNQPFYYPVVTEKNIVLGSVEGYFYILDLCTGQVQQRFKNTELTNSRNCSHPIVAEEIIYLGAQEFLRAIDLATGEQLWQFQTPFSDQWVINPQMWLYGLANQMSNLVSGKKQSLEKFAAPVIADGIVYAAYSNGYLYAFQ